MSRQGGGRARAAGLVLALVAAGLWLAATLAGVAGGPWLVAKGAAMPLLAASVALSGRPAVAAVVFALLAHGAGDVLLERSLLAGVAAFFVGHLFYLCAFWPRRRDLDETGGGTKLAVGGLALVAAGLLAVLAPRLTGPFAVAIPLYVAALAAMAAAAWWVDRGRPWVPLGASLFVVSDALLGLELFLGDVPGGRALVWPLYFAGQLAIAAGWSRAGEKPAVAPPPPGLDRRE